MACNSDGVVCTDICHRPSGGGQRVCTYGRAMEWTRLGQDAAGGEDVPWDGAWSLFAVGNLGGVDSQLAASGQG